MVRFCVLLTFEIEFLLENAQEWLEGHINLPLKSQSRSHGIHMAISLRDLRDASLENASGPSFELRNSNYANLRTNRPKKEI